MATILVVDDDRDIAGSLKQVLEQSGHTVVCAHDGQEALTMMEAANFDLVLLDILLPEVSGLDVLALSRYVHNAGRVVAMTAAGRPTILGAMREGVEVITKPFDVTRLLDYAQEAENEKKTNDTQEVSDG